MTSLDPPRRVSALADEPVVRFDDVTFSYDTGLVAIENLDLDVHAGECVGIVGPSGCGKSTLLGLIAGLHKPTAGTVTVRGEDQERHLLSMVFQKDTVLPWLTVKENIRLFYKYNRGDKREVADRIQSLLEMAQLEGFGDTHPYRLSGGMRRRVAFLTAVVCRPQILLLDEPFSSLDEPTRVAIHQDVFRIIKQFQMTTVLVTHDLAEAATLCDRVYILTGRPASIYSRHDTQFGSERDMLGLRETEDFLALYAGLWEDLRLQIRSSTDG